MFNKTTKKHRAKKVGKAGKEAAKPYVFRDIDRLMNMVNNNLCLENIQLIDAHIQTLKDSVKESNLIAKQAGVKSKAKRHKYEMYLQYALRCFMEFQYPSILFYSDQSGAMKHQQTSLLQSFMNKDDFSIPDFQIFAMRSGYGALFLELKTKDASPFLKDGSLSIDKHIRAQARSLEMLSEQGYKAVFAVGFTEAISIIREYLNAKTK